MSRRRYGQACGLAAALDTIGERWSLLVVRELSLGPLRFSELSRAVGGAPTDVLTKRLRELEANGVVERRELGPPVSATVYGLTDLGRGLERPMFELARWGMNLQRAGDVVDLAPSSLPNALRAILRPPPKARFRLGLRSGGHEFTLRAREGWIEAVRGPVGDVDLILSGTPPAVLAAVVVGGETEEAVEIEGERSLLAELRSIVVIPPRLREEASAQAMDLITAGGSAAPAPFPART
jgi:DNA-binding HxlR family transcriptional regulator